MNVNKIVREKDEDDNLVTAMTLSKAADATEKLERRCDEIRKMMKSVKIYKK